MQSRWASNLLVLILAVAISYGLMKYMPPGGSGASAPAATQSTLDRVVATKTLRFGIPIGDLPVAIRDEKGQVVGLVPDIAAEMAKSLKVNLEIVETTAPNRIPFLQAGKIDASIGTITLERAKSVSFAGVWVVDGTTMAVLASSGIKDYDGLKTKTIAAVTGATGDLVASKHFPTAKILRFDQPVTAIQAVLQKQADAVSDDISTLYLAAEKNKALQGTASAYAGAERRDGPAGRPEVDQLGQLLPRRLLRLRGLDVRLRQGGPPEVAQGRAAAAPL